VPALLVGHPNITLTVYGASPAAHRFQKAVAAKLAPKEVDPNDKSVKAFFTRARNFALAGVTHDIHNDITDDAALTEVRTA
jgi:hypothetical protein